MVFELLLLTLLDAGVGGAGSGGPQTVAALPYWNLDGGTRSVLAHRSSLTEAAPWLYGLDVNGRIQPQATPDGVAQVARLRAAGLRIVPTIANFTDGSWQPLSVQRMLHDPAAMAAHVRALAGLVRSQDYAGIDIDYEELTAADRTAFTEFLTQLAGALHADRKLLSVDVFAKTTDAGYDQRNKAQDYPAIGALADQVRVMAYDYHWSTSAPGPIAPLPWVRSVLAYATATIPPGKVILGVPLYGYDWVGEQGEAVTWTQVYGRSKEFGAQVDWDAASSSPHVTYVDTHGVRHQVWFENAYSASAKFDLARQFHLGGVYLWMFGAEDDLIWAKLATHWLPAGTGPAPSKGE